MSADQLYALAAFLGEKEKSMSVQCVQGACVSVFKDTADCRLVSSHSWCLILSPLSFHLYYSFPLLTFQTNPVRQTDHRCPTETSPLSKDNLSTSSLIYSSRGPFISSLTLVCDCILPWRSAAREINMYNKARNVAAKFNQNCSLLTVEDLHDYLQACLLFSLAKLSQCYSRSVGEKVCFTPALNQSCSLGTCAPVCSRKEPQLHTPTWSGYPSIHFHPIIQSRMAVAEDLTRYSRCPSP